MLPASKSIQQKVPGTVWLIEPKALLNDLIGDNCGAMNLRKNAKH